MPVKLPLRRDHTVDMDFRDTFGSYLQHRLALREAVNEARERGNQAIREANEEQHQDVAQLTKKYTAARSEIRRDLASAEQRAAGTNAQIGLLTQQLEEQRQCFEDVRSETSRTEANLTAVIEFAINRSDDESSRKFLALWRAGDAKPLKKAFPQFKLPATSSRRTGKV